MTPYQALQRRDGHGDGDAAPRPGGHDPRAPLHAQVPPHARAARASHGCALAGAVRALEFQHPAMAPLCGRGRATRSSPGGASRGVPASAACGAAAARGVQALPAGARGAGVRRHGDPARGQAGAGGGGDAELGVFRGTRGGDHLPAPGFGSRGCDERGDVRADAAVGAHCSRAGELL